MRRERSIAVPVRWYSGGIRTYLTYLLPRLAAFGYRFSILCSDDDGADAKIAADFEGAVSSHVVAEENSFTSFTRGVYAHMRRHSHDLIHSQGMGAAVSSALAGLPMRVPHMTTLHDTLAADHFDHRFGAIQRLALQATLGTLTAVHTIANDQRKALLRHFPGLESRVPIKTILSGIDVDRLARSERRDLRQELSLPEEEILIGYLGRFMPVKGFPDLIDAVAEGRRSNSLPPNIRILCFGWGGYIREEQERIQRLGLDDVFMFLPYTTEVGATLRGLDAVVIPSRSEAFCVIAMEALVCGVPIVASNCVGLREIIEGSPAVVVEPESPDSLLQGIMRLLCNRAASKDADSYAPVARERFDNRLLVEGIAELYESITRSR